MDVVLADSSLLKLPPCPIPRPGDRVAWYASSRLVSGDLTAFDGHGRPLIVNEHGHASAHDSVDTIRLHNPFERRGPNWWYLPKTAKILRPSEETRQRFKTLLKGPIPPGPSPFDLALEIWNRGFEIYLVGGTVRDILRNNASNDVDFVTTMPLNRSRPLISSMFRYKPSASLDRGFIRIGGSPASGDPFIDLKVFSDSLSGTEEAAFGGGFDRDVAHRDFACNAIYYDPINEVLIDPTGIGIDDALTNRLTLICQTGDSFQHAQVFLRFFKFCGRGFTPTAETTEQITKVYAKALGGMKNITKIRYIQAQVLQKCDNATDHRAALESMAALMEEFGVGDIWDSHFAPLIEEMCANGN